MGRWQEVDHTADLALHVWADNLRDLFATAARGMFSLVADIETVPLERAITIMLEAKDSEMLLVDWLNELLYWNEVEGVTFTIFEFNQLLPTYLHAVVRGGPTPGYGKYVKAATFHNLAITKTTDGYETEIVLDT
jgi:SHS2 domain-containing protein